VQVGGQREESVGLRSGGRYDTAVHARGRVRRRPEHS
jgi:hypothetical protein